MSLLELPLPDEIKWLAVSYVIYYLIRLPESLVWHRQHRQDLKALHNILNTLVARDTKIAEVLWALEGSENLSDADKKIIKTILTAPNTQYIEKG